MADWSNQYKEEAKVSDLQPDKKPDLTLSTLSQTVNKLLDDAGIDRDTDSIVRSDNFHSVFYNSQGGEIVELWACHYSVPHNNHRVYRFI